MHGAADQVRLTDLVSCGGCAAKYSAALLGDVLAGFPEIADPDLLVGLTPSDDAAVYRIDERRALVFTLDFFPPIVDDPADYGAIAATNALNDVFAMGGTPLLALSIASFPESLPQAVVAGVLNAAAAKVREAGGILAGGHTLRDEEPVFGLAAVGLVEPDRVWTKAGAKPDDVLYLTKPLGTGLLVHGLKERRIEPEELTEAVRLMQILNRRAAEALRDIDVSAVTDVTGFGLIGHAYEMATRSGVRIELEARALPALPGSLELAEAGVRTGGDPRNREYVGDELIVAGAGEAQVALAFDPQTAGGLLISLAPELCAAFEGTADTMGQYYRRIGHVSRGSRVVLRA